MSESTSLIFELIGKDSLSKDFLKAGAAVAGVGAVVADFAKKSVEAYIHAEDAQTRLSYAYKQFPAVANVSLASLKNLADETQKKTIFDHNATMEAEATLAQFKLTGSQIEILIPLVQDLAAKQGIDLTEASTAVGKAMLGSAKALKGVGIAFKATGDTAKDFTTLQGLLNDKVGGFAEAQGKTAAGQAIELQNAYKDLQETVGAALVPVMQDLVNVARPVLQTFNDLPKPVQQTVVLVGGLAVAAKVLVPNIIAAKAALIAMGTSAVVAGEETAAAGFSMRRFGAVIGKAGLWGAGIAAGIGVLALFTSAHEEAKKRVDDLTSAIESDSGALGDNTRALVAKTIVESGVLKDAHTLGIGIDTVTAAYLGNTSALDEINSKTAAFISTGIVATGSLHGSTVAYDASASAAQRLAASVGDGNQTTKDAVQNFNDFKAVQDSAAKATGTETGAVKDQTKAIKDEIPKLLDLYNAIESKTVAQYDAKDADAAAKKAIQDLGKAHHVTAQDIRDTARKVYDAADAAEKSTGKTGDYRGELVKLRDSVKKGSPLRKELDGFIARLDAAAKARTAQLALQIVYPTSVARGQSAHNAATSGKHQAAGGYGSGLTDVAEYGTERVVDLGSQSRVYTASQTAAMKANAGGQDVHVTVLLDGQTLIQSINKNVRNGVKLRATA